MHKTKNIIIKKKSVDEKIAPVIKWLNSFNSVITFYCCQGNDKEKYKPYVLFSCYEIENLLEILRVIRGYNIECHVDWALENFPLRYKLHFYNTDTLQEFVKTLK